jgi:protein gp37
MPLTYPSVIASAVRDLLRTKLRFAAARPHIWCGTSVENKNYGLPRIEHLRSAPARVRFLSIEPLLEDLGALNFSDIHWVIVGGESGSGARLMRREWVVSVRRQCREQNVPFFFKQWGGVRKARSGRLLDGRTYDEMPTEFDAVRSPTAKSLWHRSVRSRDVPPSWPQSPSAPSNPSRQAISRRMTHRARHSPQRR